jgi:hypothetical protein
MIIKANNRKLINSFLDSQDGLVEIKPVKDKRTNQQNRALHLYFKHLSEAFNEAGLDVKATLSEDIDHPWTPELVKEHIWRPVQKSYTQKESTTKLNRTQIDEILMIISKYIGEKFGISVAFPCIDELYDKEN